MFRKDYNQLVINRVEEKFDRILPVGVVIAWASAVAILFGNIPRYFALLNGLIGVLFLWMNFRKTTLSAKAKIVITIMTPTFIGVAAFMDGGFTSAGITLMMISNVVAVLFLDRKTSISISVITAFLFIALFAYAHVHPVGLDVHQDFDKWMIHFFVMLLYLFIMHTVVYAIRAYLLENISDLEESVAEAYDLAYYDQLTKLMNMNMLIESVKDSGYLLILNFKNLNLINSIYGDGIGDMVLIETAKLLRQYHSKGKSIVRVSGNEMGLWFHEMSLADFLERVDFLITTIQDKFEIYHYNIKLEFFLSYAEHKKEDDIKDTIHKARLALTYAKTNSETSLVAYDAILEKIIRKEEQMKERLASALKNNEFQVYYQPKINTLTKEVISVEALARWHDSLLGAISPNTFIPLIEKTNNTIEFGKLIIDHVFSDFEAISDKYGKHVKVSINISPSHLISGGFASFVKNAILSHNIASNRVVFELTEEVVINNLTKVSKNIDTLKKLGIAISLDDFGSGYSSLNYLASLNIDEIKIDKTFVEQINKDHKVNVLIDMLIKLSKAYHLNIVAEGVETYEQYDFLKEHNCDEIQGFLFYKPQPL